MESARTGQGSLDPFEEFLPLGIFHSLDEIERFVKAFESGIGLMLELRSISDLLFSNRKEAKVEDLPKGDALTGLFRLCDEIEPIAKAHAGEKYVYLYNTCTVRLWVVLEAVITEFIVFLIHHHPPSRGMPLVRKLRGPLVDFVVLPPEEQARVIVDLLADELRIKGAPGVGRFEALLSAIGLGGPIDDDVRRALLELAEAPHIIVHRQEKVDIRFLGRCPWYGAREGDRLQTTAGRFHRYAVAARWYSLELVRRWLDARPDDRKVGPAGMKRLADAMGQAATHVRALSDEHKGAEPSAV